MRNQLKTNRLFSLAVCAMAMLLIFTSSFTYAKNPRVLVFCKTGPKGFQHGSIPSGIAAVFKLGKENKFDVDISADPADFNDANLKQYAAIICVSTTADFIPQESQRAALKNYIEHGGGFVGIHAATDAEYNWQWYGDLVGGYFKGHPRGTPQATLDVVDSTSIATKFLPRRWTRVDEWYHFKYITKDLHVLIKLDENSFVYPSGDEKLKMGPDHPMAWYHDFDGGRAFYTELGHTDDSYSDPLYLKHLLGGIEYAMGRKKMQP